MELLSGYALRLSFVPQSSIWGVSVSLSMFLNLTKFFLQGENVPAPFMSFEAAGFSPDLLREVCPTSSYFSWIVKK